MGRCIETWTEYGKVDMKRFGLVKDYAHNRDKWRCLRSGNRQELSNLCAVLRVLIIAYCVLVMLNVNDDDDDEYYTRHSIKNTLNPQMPTTAPSCVIIMSPRFVLQ